MPYKNIEDRRACRRKWYKNNKESEKEHIYRRKREIKEWFEEYKSGLCCEICGETFSQCLEFHHENPEEKEHSIREMVSSGYSIVRILEEISKCRVLCANCHRKEHYK